MFSDRKTFNIPFLTENYLIFKSDEVSDFKFYTNYLFESLKLKFLQNKMNEMNEMNENFIYGSRLQSKENFDFN